MRHWRPAKLSRKRCPRTVAFFLVFFTPLSTALADPGEPAAPAPPAAPAAPSGVAAAPALATHDVPNGAVPAQHRAFYESGWFWGAVGAAAFAGGVVFLATRDSKPSAIHLHVEVPR
jgi:hypothetical protein